MTLDQYIDELLKVKEKFGGDIVVYRMGSDYDLEEVFVPVSPEHSKDFPSFQALVEEEEFLLL